MEIMINENDVLIRTEYDKNVDLVHQYQYNNSSSNNPNFSSKATYLLPKSVCLTSDLSAYLIHNTNDSISALETTSYWFLLGQHGYYIPRVTAKGNTFHIGEQVVNEEGSSFKVIHKNEDFIYLAPDIEQVNGATKRSWTFKGKRFTKLTSSANKTSVPVTAVSGFQVTMLNRKKQKIFIDGREVSEKKRYKGENIELIDVFACINPVGASFDGIQTMSGEELIEVSQSYYFEGKSIYSSTGLDVKSDLRFVKYHGIQPTGLVTMGDYIPYAMFPKVKPQPASKNRMAVDWNYPTNVDDPENDKYVKYLFKANNNDIVDINDIPDRTIQFLQNSVGDFKIGFASGFDLETGLTAKKYRPKLVHEAFHIATNLQNKTYFRALTSKKFKDETLPSSFKGRFNAYFVYYIPSPNLQPYIIHGKKYAYIYIHTQENFNSKEIIVEGLKDAFLTVVESKGIKLHSDKIVNRRIVITSSDNNSNYLVLKAIK